MTRFCYALSWMFALASCSSSPGPMSGHKRDIVIDGSSTMNPMLVAAAQRLAGGNAGYHVEVRGSSSGEGIRQFIDGKIDVAASSRAPKEAEHTQALEKGRQIHLTTVAFDGLVVIVHRDNPVHEFTEAQLRAVFFDGNITDWSQLGAGRKTGPIHVYAAPAKQSGLTDFLAHRLTGKSDTPLVVGAKSPKTDPELIKAAAGDPDGISIAAFGRAKAYCRSGRTASVSVRVPARDTGTRTGLNRGVALI